MLYEHFLDGDNIMEPIPTPPTESILTTQQIFNDYGQQYKANVNYNEFSSDDSDWENDDNNTDWDDESPLYKEQEMELFSDIEEKANSEDDKMQDSAKTNKMQSIFQKAEQIEYQKTKIANIFKKAEEIEHKNTKVKDIFKQAEEIEQQKNKNTNVFMKQKIKDIFDKAEKISKRNEEKEEKENLRKKPLYYVHVKRQRKRCLFCGGHRHCKKINTAGGRDLFFTNRLLIYPNKHHVCIKCDKKNWKDLEVNKHFEKEEILSSAHLNIIEKYLTALRNIYDCKDYKKRTKYENNIDIDKIGKQQCKKLTKIQLENIKDMAAKSGLEFKKCFIFWYYLGNIDSWVKTSGIFGPSKSTLHNWYSTARKALFEWSKKVCNKHRINREYIQKNTNEFAKIVLGIEDKPDTCVVMMDSFSIKIQQPSKLIFTKLQI